MNHELPHVQTGFRKGRESRDQIVSICWIIRKAREFEENIFFCFIDYVKDFVDHHKLWKILKEMLIPDHLTYLLRNLYTGQETTVRTGHRTTNRLVPIQKRSTSRLYIVTLLFNFYAESSSKMPGWIKHNLESRFPEEIPTTSDMQMTQMTPPLWQKAKRN